ncbi:hypothetical protein KUCAC02_007219 [Chaenocephalus aceratus]|uniref:Uncharacterized protein n=1 Tax=Chaenocephalus aceratus TaxID=36190 RepID=A0ACB9X639_CHAAC|nr:hypothetical protein KUCAC02_007219 [Chaenocephalus aceratus]
MSTEELSASDSEAVLAGAGERWAPVGAVASPEDERWSAGQPKHRGSSTATEGEMAGRLEKLEGEQDLLNSSLLALTSHFAQVQFRLKQIVHAQSDEKEKMLVELEEFAFRGCPHVVGCRGPDAQQLENSGDLTQLDDLERFAYQEGSYDSLPQSVVMERQKVIIDELIKKLDVNLNEDIGNLSPEELRQKVDSAIAQIVNPARVKEQLVDQLKTQIRDLEMFINFIQDEVGNPLLPDGAHSQQPRAAGTNNKTPGMKRVDPEQAQKMRESSLRASLAARPAHVPQNIWPQEAAQQDYGPLLQRLETAVDKVRVLGSCRQPSIEHVVNYTSNSALGPRDELTSSVRKELAFALKDLLAHGLFSPSQTMSLVLAPILLPAALLYSHTEHPACRGRPGDRHPKQSLLWAVHTVLKEQGATNGAQTQSSKRWPGATWPRLASKAPCGILGRISHLKFNLPVDLAVRQLKNIKDAF